MRIAKKRRLGVIYTPLDVSVDIVPYGGTVDRQVYNSATGGFYPDYEDGPLCLFPVCRAVTVSSMMATSTLKEHDKRSAAFLPQSSHVRGTESPALACDTAQILSSFVLPVSLVHTTFFARIWSVTSSL